MASFPFKNKHISVIYGSTTEDNQPLSTQSETSQGMIRPAGIFTRIHVDHYNKTDADEYSSCATSAHGVISLHTPSSYSTWRMVTADCPGLVTIDTEHNTIGLLHLGWLQLYLNAPKKFLRLWRTHSLSSVSEIQCFISPSICKNCFTLTGTKGWLRIALFKLSPWKSFLQQNDGIYSLDLRGLLLFQLTTNGISARNIHIAPECTVENPDLSSHRREGASRRSSNVITVVRSVQK